MAELVARRGGSILVGQQDWITERCCSDSRMAAVVVVFALAGLGMIGIPILNSAWQMMAVLGAVISLFLLALYWHPWLVMGVAINLAVLVSIWQQWPVVLFPAK